MMRDWQALLEPWSGPFGGLPPFDGVTPDALETAYRAAVESKRAEIHAIATRAAEPTFVNTIEALEDCGRPLQRMQTLLSAFSQTMATGDMPVVAQRLASLAPALDDETAHDDRLFARVAAVYRSRSELGLTAIQVRLVERMYDRLVRRGAGLGSSTRLRLAAINARYANLFARFATNLQIDERRMVWIDDEAALGGINDALKKTLREAAVDEGRADGHAVRNMRAVVWPFLTQSTNRDLRERVWRMWSDRGGHNGEHDNRPIVSEILALRGEKAKLLGYPTFAHLATANRMAGAPETVLAVLQRAWTPVYARTIVQIAACQQIADDEGATFCLAPWDRLHYAEKVRQAKFCFDTEAMRPYLALDAVLDAMCWGAGRLHGLVFRDITAEVSRLDETVRVFALRRDDEATGVLYVDLFARPGKGHGSYQMEWRTGESFRERVLPISCIVSNLPGPGRGEPVLLTWEYANVLFHEFGHALHILSNTAPYPSLGSLHVAWDFVELPSLLNERWLGDRELLARFARHDRTGEPMPPALVDALEASLQYDRIFSVNLDYLACAFIDMRMHLLADGRPDRQIDAVAVERETLAELRMPEAWDLVMRVPNFWHAWSEHYAAGLYVYLWADVMAADVAEAFEASPGGWYDEGTATRWRETILGVGDSVPAEEAFFAFRGRDPDPDALMRRFGLTAAR